MTSISNISLILPVLEIIVTISNINSNINDSAIILSIDKNMKNHNNYY